MGTYKICILSNLYRNDEKGETITNNGASAPASPKPGRCSNQAVNWYQKSESWNATGEVGAIVNTNPRVYYYYLCN